MSIIYEVNLEVDLSVSEAFASWLNDHIKQMLEIDGFLDATLLRVVDDNPNSKWCVQYELASHEALEHYFDHEAKQMRKDGINRFGDLMKANRRILEPED